jgi:hypothetical protein
MTGIKNPATTGAIVGGAAGNGLRITPPGAQYFIIPLANPE